MKKRNLRPRRTVLFAFGHDEEVGGHAHVNSSAPSAGGDSPCFSGHDGAAHIVALLQARGVRPWLVLDEGGPIVTGQIPGVAAPVALVGVSEKLSVKVRYTTCSSPACKWA